MKEMKKISVKERIIRGILYLGAILPMIFSMYNSVPASDDFSFGTHKVSDNLLVEAFGYSNWCWVHHSGRWLTFFVQKLIVPLNYRGHLGRVYGLFMIVTFLVFFYLLKTSLQTILKKVFDIDGSILKNTVLCIIFVLFTTYYYCETFNWFTGATSYAIPLGLLLLMLALLIKYEETGNNKYYIGMIFAGLLPANSEVFDISIALLYLYFTFILYKFDIKERKVLWKKLVPLVIFILDGLSTVIAPGNYVRQDVYQVTPNVVLSVKQIIINSVTRLQDIIVNHPLTVLIFAVLFIIGIRIGSKDGKVKIINLVILIVLMLFGIQFPYVHGKAMYFSYLDVRMQFLVDYSMLIGVSIIFTKLGQMVSYKYEIEYTEKVAVVSAVMVIMLAYLSVIQNYAYLDIVQIDILRNKSLITQNYSLWDGIISEIETSTDDDVVIYRDAELDWTPYFLYMGLTNGDVFSAKKDVLFDDRCIMPNIYYQKNSIKLIYKK